MKKLILLFSLSLICSLNNKVTSQNLKNEEIKKFLDTLSDNTFSGTILIASNDSIIEKKAYGLASKELNVKNKIDTKFNIASISKTFTAVAILQLMEQGKLDLNTPIGKYLEDYPNEIVKNKVTIAQLLTHTAGLPNFYVTNFLDKCKFEFKEVEDFVPLFENAPLLSVPGSEYNYDAAGYVLLGLIIQKVTGDNYYEYLSKNIFDKADMKNTGAYDVDAIIPNKANGYTFAGDPSKPLKNNIFYLSKASPGGFHYSTVEDLFKFNKALFDNEFMSKQTVALMTQPRVKGYNTHLGFGIDVDQRYEETILGQSGGWYGISGEIIYFTDSKYTITILSNIDTNMKSGKAMVSDFLKELIAGEKQTNP